MTQIKDFIGTIADDDEISVCEESSDSEDQVKIIYAYSCNIFIS